MSLSFGKLGVATKTYYVQKTGFPFYDACQLIGAMHYFFGTSTSSIRDQFAHWEITGSATGQNTANYGERLKNKGLERIEQTTLSNLEKLESVASDIEEFFEAASPKTNVTEKSKQEGVSRYLEPAWLTGARGQDAAIYSVLASQRGVPSKRPVPESLIATLGLTQVALAYGNDEILAILPVLENTLQPMQPFLTHKQRYQHSAGGSVSAVLASLGLLVELGQKYRIADFAFAFHGGRGFYYSGLLGLHRLCGQFKNVQTFSKQALNYLQRSNRSDPGVALDLARLIADFVKNPSLKTLTGIVRTKSRIQSSQETAPWVLGASTELLSTTQSIKEAISMVEGDKHIPPPSEGLVQALGEVFRAEKKGTWIGAYINLERAHKADEFYAEVSKILSRALSRAESDKSDKRWLPSRIKEALSLLTSQEVLSACEPSNRAYFSAHKTTFLLRVLGNMKYQASNNSSTNETGGDEE